MENFTDREGLYRYTLDSAGDELKTLSREIEWLQTQLSRLERKKQVAQRICQALGSWVELTRDADTAPDPEADGPFLEFPPLGVRLTEEEVTRLAYPKISQQSA